MRFKDYLESDGMEEEKKDILNTLNKVPASHRNLVKGYNWKFSGGNTLKGDDQHVGYMDGHEKEIAVAAPWNYAREFTILHELAHTVWEKLPKNIKQQWFQLVSQTKNNPAIGANSENQDSLNQNPEELFCHTYANYYAKHKILTYYKPEWFEFIRKIN